MIEFKIGNECDASRIHSLLRLSLWQRTPRILRLMEISFTFKTASNLQ